MARVAGLWIGLGMVAALVAVGCDAGETTTAGTSGTAGTGGTGGTGGAGGGLVCPDDPAKGAVDPGCGIWVSASKGNDTNEGSQAEPVASLAHAIELAEKGPGRVYACGETWDEALLVPSGVSLHGGFDCAVGWTYVGETMRATVNAPSAPRPIAVSWIYNGSMKQAFLTDFLVQSSNAAEPGGSSIACFVRDDVPIHMIRSECAAGDGADGVDGAPGSSNGVPAMAGTPGNGGSNACSASLSKGGAPVETACDPATSKGGAGGDSSTMIAANGADGEPAGDPPGGAGGLGEQLAPACTAGSAGANGADGADGEGAGTHPSEAGRLTVDGHLPEIAKDGASGAPGQGGGGGGATFGSAAVCGAVSSGGAAGGSGGAGGCGGKGGKPGQSGGASIALASRGSQVLIQNVVLRSGNGGNGGKGGVPQLGGEGGDGGSGGKGSGAIQPGCAGGKGGSGGKGGYGGGGAGGWSIQIAWVNAPVLVADDLQTYGGEPGKGGEGNPAKVASWGEDGGQLYSLPLDP